MIKLKLGDIFQGTKILISLTDKELAIKAGYKLNKIVESCLIELPKIEKCHTDLVLKYSGGTDKVLPENTEVFLTELNDFLQSEVEIMGEKLSVEEIEDCKIKPVELKIIESFLSN